MNKEQTNNKEAGIPTLDQLKNWEPNQDQKKAAELVFLNMANVGTIKPIVTKYQNKILLKHKFKIDGQYKDIHIKNNNGRDYVKDQSESYLMSDSDFKIYEKELHQAHLKHGFNVKYGYCPLLIAESDLREAENLFLDVITPVFGITRDHLIGLDHREKFLDLALTLIAKFIDSGEELINKYFSKEAA